MIWLLVYQIGFLFLAVAGLFARNREERADIIIVGMFWPLVVVVMIGLTAWQVIGDLITNTREERK